MVSRRAFLAGTATAASSARIWGANDRLRLGVIGTGGRGTYHTGNLAKRTDVEVVAVCDVYKTRAQAACEKAGIAADVVQDYRRVIERKDIDAVVIAATDHWHTAV